MVKKIDKKAFLTYPAASFIVSALGTVLMVLLFSINTRNVFLVLAIVFGALSMTGSLDELFDTAIGLFLAKNLCLVERSKLKNEEYEMDAKGSISRGVSTIEMSLTLIWILIFVFLR